MSVTPGQADRRDAIDVAAPMVMVVLTFSWGLNGVAAKLTYAGYGPVFLTFLAWFWLVGRYPASRLSSFSFLTPAFGVPCGGVLLGEPLSATIIIALVLIAAGLSRADGQTRKQSQPVP